MIHQVYRRGPRLESPPQPDYVPGSMDKQAIRQVLEQIAALLELKGENPFRVRAFQNAGRAIAGFPGDVAAAAASGELAAVPGIGRATLEIVRELAATGRSSALEDLREQVPPGLVDMLRVPGLGVAKVRQIHDRLRVTSLPELEAAAADGRLAELPRFGAKTAENVRKGIAFLRRSTGLRLFHQAADELEGVRQAIASLEGVRRVELAGGVRRRCELIRELTLVAVHGNDGSRDALVQRLGRAPGVTELEARGGTITLRFAAGSVVEVHLAAPQDFGLAWVRATGSAEHVAQLEARAATCGVPLDAASGFSDEASLYRALSLAWIPPELREGAGEFDAAAAGKLPALLEPTDLQGLVHCHTNYSDGTVTVAEWAAACRAAGYRWGGITDHSPSAAYAGGLAPDDIARQHAEIDAANAGGGGGDGFRVLKGAEADILADGTLDYGPVTLDRFDFVIGSIHSRPGMTETEKTGRVLPPIDDPHLTILGHPTGRLLLQRDPYPLDLERVLAKAAQRGIAIEANADSHRLDLDWRMLRHARQLGVTAAIGAGARPPAGLAHAR